MDTQDGERCSRGLPSASRPECPLPELEIQKKEKKNPILIRNRKHLSREQKCRLLSNCQIYLVFQSG